jgi:hypothetical protein
MLSGHRRLWNGDEFLKEKLIGCKQWKSVALKIISE